MTATTGDVAYKTIPTEFKKKGFVYKQIQREGHRAIFLQTRPGSAAQRYEVVKIGRHNGYVMGGVQIAPAETYPGSSVWGLSGWTCVTLADAQAKYGSI